MINDPTTNLWNISHFLNTNISVKFYYIFEMWWDLTTLVHICVPVREFLKIDQYLMKLWISLAYCIYARV